MPPQDVTVVLRHREETVPQPGPATADPSAGGDFVVTVPDPIPQELIRYVSA